MSPEAKPLAIDRYVAAVNLIVAASVWLGLHAAAGVRPAWAVVVAAIMTALLAASSVGLVMRARWADLVSLIMALGLLAAGLLVTFGLMLGLTFFRAVGGPGASIGPTLYALAILLALPYTILYPLAVLLWLRSRGRPR